MTRPAQLEEFLRADTATRSALLRRDGVAATVRDYMGDAALSEYATLAATPSPAHLASRPEKNVIFVPGLMGSMLQSRTLPGLWWVDVRSRQHIKDLRLGPDGLTDANPSHEVWASGVDVSYEPFMLALLRSDAWAHQTFAYDWRKPIHLAADALAIEIERLHERNGGLPIHLAAHSMGGMVVRAMLASATKELWKKIARIVFMATPHYGAPAVGGYLKNHLWGFELMAVLGRYLDRPALRSFWGFLSLMPAPEGLYPDTRRDDVRLTMAGESDPLASRHPCGSFDFYDADAWQLPDLDASGLSALQTILDHARRFHEHLASSHANLPVEYRERMLVIAGVGYKTLFRLEETAGFLGVWERMRKITDREPGNPHREGDGRVPLASAMLDGVHTVFVRGVHSQIPNIPEVSTAVMNWFAGQPVLLPETAASALSRHLGSSAAETAPHLDGSVRASGEDPGYWRQELSQPLVSELDRRVQQDELPEFHFVRLF